MLLFLCENLRGVFLVGCQRAPKRGSVGGGCGKR